MSEAQVAVLIDYENVGLDSIAWLFDQISDVGRIILKRAYADWSTTRRDKEQILALGIEPVHHFRLTRAAKNASDIRLAVDAIDLLHRNPVDVFVIVSSDSDFVPLVRHLRAGGKEVIGAGRKSVVSKTLVTSCDRYFFLDEVEKGVAAASPAQARQNESPLIRAVKASMDDHGRVVGARLHQTMRRIDPSFSFKALGYRTFTEFLEASPDVHVSRPEGRGDVTVEVASNQRGASVKTNEEQAPDRWAHEVDAAWSQRARQAGETVPGTWAAGEAARVLGAPKLSASEYRTLQRLLDASDYLRSRWSRDGNTLTRR